MENIFFLLIGNRVGARVHNYPLIPRKIARHFPTIPISTPQKKQKCQPNKAKHKPSLSQNKGLSQTDGMMIQKSGRKMNQNKDPSQTDGMMIQKFGRNLQPKLHRLSS